MIGKWHLGSDPVGFDRWEILPGQGAYVDPVLYTATGEKSYTGRYVTDVITDLGIDFIKNRPRNKPFFLMLHHKAPHRPWQPDAVQAARFKDRWIPEPETLWDSYDTRTDALRENQQRIAADLTRRDLKLQPPPDSAGAGAHGVAGGQARHGDDGRRREDRDAHGRGADAVEVPALHARLPCDGAIRG